VRIAMTVAAAGRRDGQLLTVGNEPTGTEDAREVLLISTRGHLHADLSIGPELDSAVPLRANDGLCSRGVSLHGSGFIVTPDEAKQLGLGTVGGLERRIRPYRNGKDLTSKPRGVFVIDLFGLSEAEAMERFPAVYQWLLERVRPQRDALKGGTADSEQYARTWWLFGKTRPELRRALIGIERFVCTGETAKHRIFQVLDAPVLPDNTIVNVALCDAFHLGVLSSGTHVVWALAAGGRLGIGNDPRYNKTRCFDPFPFPDPPEPLRMRIRELGEKLDAFRKERQAAHPGLTLTGMYNVLEALRAGRPLADKERTIHEQGLVSVLKQIHDELDVAVAEAYGWPADLPDEEVLERLVALNRERAAEEAAGHVRWLRPEFQNPEGKATAGRAAELALVADEAGVAARRAWPRSLPEQVQAVREVLAEAEAPADAEAVARRFARAPRRQVGELLATLVALNQAREPVAGRFAA
jgi:hypothetical protein